MLETTNADSITLVLLPGLDGTGILFASLLAALPANINTIVINYPASGTAGYAELTSFVQARLPTNVPYVLLGESFSGPIAISLASRADINLQGLILCASFASNPLPVFRKMGGLLPILPFQPALFFSHLVLGSAGNAALQVQVKRALATLTPAILHQRLQAVLAVDVTSELQEIAVPILYLRANQDRLVPAAATKRVLALRPDCRVKTVDAPHLLLQTKPQQAAELISEFIESLRAS